MATFWNKLGRIGRVMRGVDEQVEAKFDVAQTTPDNRRHWANADGLSARAAVSPEVRRVVRIRSRYEADNNSWYRGMLRTAVNHIVGKGPQLQVTTGNREVDLRIEATFQRWATHSDFAGQLRLMVEAYWRDGEVFARKIERPSQWPRTMQLGIETVEADRVASPFDVSPYDEFTEDGIRLDQYTRELAYYVYDRHPGSTSAASTLSGIWEPSSDVLHLFREERPGQIRGIPRVTAGLQMLPIMRRQELATLFSAETAANFAMFLKSNSPAINPARSPANFMEIEVARNMLTTLPPGWDVVQQEPAQPGPNYEMFQRQTLQSFARCTNMPYALAAGTGRESNFSSLKADMKNVWEPEVQVEQCDIESAVVARVFAWFLEAAVYEGGILDGAPPTAEIKHRWVWPPLPELDAVEAAKASALRLSTGQSSPSDELGRRGSDWETESARGAQDFGVSIDEYKRAVFEKTFGLKAEVLPQAEGDPKTDDPEEDQNDTDDEDTDETTDDEMADEKEEVNA